MSGPGGIGGGGGAGGEDRLRDALLRDDGMLDQALRALGEPEAAQPLASAADLLARAALLAPPVAAATGLATWKLGLLATATVAGSFAGGWYARDAAVPVAGTAPLAGPARAFVVESGPASDGAVDDPATLPPTGPAAVPSTLPARAAVGVAALPASAPAASTAPPPVVPAAPGLAGASRRSASLQSAGRLPACEEIPSCGRDLRVVSAELPEPVVDWGEPSAALTDEAPAARIAGDGPGLAVLPAAQEGGGDGGAVSAAEPFPERLPPVERRPEAESVAVLPPSSASTRSRADWRKGEGRLRIGGGALVLGDTFGDYIAPVGLGLRGDLGAHGPARGLAAPEIGLALEAGVLPGDEETATRFGLALDGRGGVQLGAGAWRVGVDASGGLRLVPATPLADAFDHPGAGWFFPVVGGELSLRNAEPGKGGLFVSIGGRVSFLDIEDSGEVAVQPWVSIMVGADLPAAPKKN